MPFWCGGQAQQYLRREVFQYRTVTGGGNVVHFINYDVVVIVVGQFQLIQLVIQGLNRHEQLAVVFRQLAAYPEFAKGIVSQNATIGFAGLPQNFFPVRHKQKMGVWPCFQETLKIKRRDQGFASARGGHHEVSKTLVHVPLYR